MPQTQEEHIQGLRDSLNETRDVVGMLRKKVKELEMEVESWIMVARHWRDKYKNEKLERR